MIVTTLILGFLLRTINLDQSLWLDEAIGAIVVKEMNLWEILTKFPLSDNHPPLYYLILKLWTMLFGLSEISLRLPSVIFGSLIIYLVYKITKNKFSALLVATSPILIYYSQESRMYMMAAFLTTLAIYLFINKKFAWLSVALTALIFTDYVPVFFLPVPIIYSLIIKQDIKKTFMAYIPMAIVGLFWLPTFLYQLEVGKTLTQTLPAWQDLAGGATLKQIVLFWNKMILGRISFYPKEIYYTLVAICSIPLAYAFFKSLKRQNLLFLLWFVFPIVAGFLASFIFPAFIYFRFIYVIPAFYILVGSIKNKYLIWAMVVANLIGFVIYTLDGSQHRENWKESVAFTETSLAENEVVLLNYPEPFAPYRWYSKEASALGVADSISVNPELTRNKVSKFVQNYSGLYYFDYLESLTDPNKVVRNELQTLGFINKKTYTFNGVGKVEYLVKQNENSN